MQFEAFWNSAYAERIRRPEPVRQLLKAVGNESSKLYDLTFYASFAKKMFTIMQREGKETPGFPRMQQSFSEAVEKVRNVVEYSAAKGFAKASVYAELSQAGMAHMLELIEDLSTIKDWQVHAAGEEDAMNG